MEILALFLLYILSQNPEFPQRVQPIVQSLKNSEHMLRFMNDLSSFSTLFDEKKDSPKKGESKKDDAKKPQPPLQGIADDFIQECLKKYLKKD